MAGTAKGAPCPATDIDIGGIDDEVLASIDLCSSECLARDGIKRCVGGVSQVRR